MDRKNTRLITRIKPQYSKLEPKDLLHSLLLSNIIGVSGVLLAIALLEESRSARIRLTRSTVDQTAIAG